MMQCVQMQHINFGMTSPLELTSQAMARGGYPYGGYPQDPGAHDLFPQYIFQCQPQFSGYLPSPHGCYHHLQYSRAPDMWPRRQQSSGLFHKDYPRHRQGYQGPMHNRNDQIRNQRGQLGRPAVPRSTGKPLTP